MGEKQVFVVTIVVVSIVLVIVGTFTYLSYKNYCGLTDKKKVLDKKIDEHDLVIAEKPTKEAELNASRARFENVKRYLPDTKAVDTLLDAFSTKCIESKLKLHRLERVTQIATRRPGQGVKQDVEEIQFKGEFRGSYHSLAKFVSMVEDWEHFKRFVSITEFRMKAGEKGLAFDTGTQMHTVAMTFRLYKYEEPKRTTMVSAGGGPARVNR
jgi:Tfp pilus assembly protein PilO